jgi:hypothetical protein
MRPSARVVLGRILEIPKDSKLSIEVTHSGDAMETENIFSSLKVVDLASF